MSRRWYAYPPGRSGWASGNGKSTGWQSGMTWLGGGRKWLLSPGAARAHCTPVRLFRRQVPGNRGAVWGFVLAGGYQQCHYWTGDGWAWREAHDRAQPDLWEEKRWTADDRLPVVGTTWYEAHAFCRWLAEASGLGYRLPTEAEWEKAARGTGGSLFPWGDAFDSGHCNARPAGIGQMTPVGQYSPVNSPYGCADMAGNVSEWTASEFRSYPYRVTDGRDDPEEKSQRVTRGGSWHSPILRVRTVSRGMNDPSFSDNDLGFRCARST